MDFDSIALFIIFIGSAVLIIENKQHYEKN